MLRAQSGLKMKPTGMVWDLGIPLWRGEDLSGKSILVHHEQGFGDTIMWSRYVPQVADLARHGTARFNSYGKSAPAIGQRRSSV